MQWHDMRPSIADGIGEALQALRKSAAGGLDRFLGQHGEAPPSVHLPTSA